MAGGHRPADRPGHHHVVATVPAGDLADLQVPANARVLSFTPMPRSWTGLPAPLPTTARARRGRRSPAACPSALSRSAVTSSNSPAASRSPEPEHGCPPQNGCQRRSLQWAAQPPRPTPSKYSSQQHRQPGTARRARHRPAHRRERRRPAGDVARCRSIGPAHLRWRQRRRHRPRTLAADDAGLVSIARDIRSASMRFWRSVFERRAPQLQSRQSTPRSTRGTPLISPPIRCWRAYRRGHSAKGVTD